MAVKQPRHRARARVIGRLELLCPWCGCIQSHSLNRLSWKIICKDCRKKIGIGITLYDLSALVRTRILGAPEDMIFPEVPIVPLHSAEHVVRVIP
jgi:hypothetical protein